MKVAFFLGFLLIVYAIEGGNITRLVNDAAGNQGVGLNNLYKGQGNRWMGDRNIMLGQHNSIDGFDNKVLGATNIIKGQVNVIDGKRNTIEGQQNTVKGQNNLVIGSGNVISNDLNSVDFDIELQKRLPQWMRSKTSIKSIATSLPKIEPKEKQLSLTQLPSNRQIIPIIPVTPQLIKSFPSFYSQFSKTEISPIISNNSVSKIAPLEHIIFTPQLTLTPNIPSNITSNIITITQNIPSPVIPTVITPSKVSISSPPVQSKMQSIAPVQQKIDYALLNNDLNKKIQVPRALPSNRNLDLRTQIQNQVQAKLRQAFIKAGINRY